MKKVALRIERFGLPGETPDVALYLDGCESSKYEVSRALTGTTDEVGSGIFSYGITKFYRGSDSVIVDLGERFRFYDKSASELMDIITERANMVRDAFAEKFPAVKEACERTFIF